jgi:L,D-transpeptidase ErfK/SrfK
MNTTMRKQAAFTYGLWCAALVGGTAALAWNFGWIPVEITTAETGTLSGPSVAATEPVPKTGEQAEPNEPGVDPIVFAAQTEPETPSAARPVRSATSEREPPAELWAETTNLPREHASVGATVGSQQRPTAATGFTPPQRDPRIAPASLQIEEGDLREIAPPRPLPRSAPRVIPDVQPKSARRAIRPTIIQTAGEADAAFGTAGEEDQRLQAIDQLIEQGETLAAHKELSRIYWKEPEIRTLIQERIDGTAKAIYFSPQPHFMEPYTVQSGDQLRKVAGQYRVAWQFLARLNQVDPARIRVGQRLKVIKGPFSALVDLSDFELIVHAHGYYVRRYRIGIGRDGSSPTGKFTVLNKVANPQYTDPDGRVVQGDDPANPLGERWLDLGNSYGIHGTIEPDSIGRSESRGCVRMLNADVEEVYDLLDVGSEVMIRR